MHPWNPMRTLKQGIEEPTLGRIALVVIALAVVGGLLALCGAV